MDEHGGVVGGEPGVGEVMGAAASSAAPMTAPLVVEYPFHRTTGPVIGAFFTALRERFVVGVRARDGRVLVPPFEYDPVSGEDLTEIVEVGDEGVVTTWSWAAEPLESQPLERPFAWALIRLDGADTPMLHVVDAGSPSAMSTGMRVKASWRDEREGHILDIECFRPAGDEAAATQGGSLDA